MVKRYANERIAQKYRNAVMNVMTVLSETEIRNLNLCNCSIQIGFRVNNQPVRGVIRGNGSRSNGLRVRNRIIQSFSGCGTSTNE